MKKRMTITILSAVLGLTGCTTQGPEAAQTAGAALTTEAFTPNPRVPLLNYTAEQILQVLEGLPDSEGTKPAQLLSHEAMVAQSNANAAKTMPTTLTPEIDPESCTPFVNLAPILEDGLTTGTAMFSSPAGMTTMIMAAVDPVNGHDERAENNASLIKECGNLTLKIAGQEAKLTMTEVPLEIESENSLAVRATGTMAGTELNMVSFTANTGSVLLSGAAISTANFDEPAVLQDLSLIIQDALDRFAELPATSTANRNSSTTPR